jgi:hypothetical protein
MLTKTRSTPVHSPAPGVIPDTITGPVSNGSPARTDPHRAPTQAPAAPAQSDPAGGSAATERDERRHQTGPRAGGKRSGCREDRRTPPTCQEAADRVDTTRTTRRRNGACRTDRHHCRRVDSGSHPRRSRGIRLGRRPARRDTDRDPLGGPPALPTPALTPAKRKQSELGAATGLGHRDSPRGERQFMQTSAAAACRPDRKVLLVTAPRVGC